MAKLIREQANLMLLALSFFTRIPVTLSVEVTPKMLDQASRYFALVGVIVGSVSALVFYLTSLFLPVTVALLLAMAASVLVTGAFHEDGWADVWDGFGGGWTITNKLDIMKDSRLGTYGAAALFFILMLKYQSLQALTEHTFALTSAFILAHTLSRAVATSLIYSMSYVSEDARSKVKPLAQTLSSTSLLVLLITCALFMALCLPLWVALKLTGILLITRWLLTVWFKQQLRGYTGDCLGAAQQISELIIYLSLLVFTAELL